MSLPDLLAAADATRDELLTLFQDVVRFPTVNTGVMPTGNETPCAEYLRDVLAADDIAAQVVESAPGRGNLLAQLGGDGNGRSMLWMSHLDVVPEGDASRWTVPPFGGEYHDGWVYGRGANDCKGVAVAEVHALRLLGRLGAKLPGALKLAAGADEESGGTYGFGWLARHHAEALRADLGLNEGGGWPATLADGRPAYLVALGEKGRYEATITLLGHSEHAAAPWHADSPLFRLAEVLLRIDGWEAEIFIDHPAVTCLTQLWGERMPTAEHFDELLARRVATHPGDASRLRALSRATMAPTVVRAGAKSNAIPDQAVLTVDIRTTPGRGKAYVQAELERLLAGIPGVVLDVETTADPSSSEVGPEVEEALLAAFDAIDEPATLLPTLCVGFTDSRLVRPLGMPVIGFAPVPYGTPLDRCGCHNLDEQFPLEAVAFRVKYLLALAWNWCR